MPQIREMIDDRPEDGVFRIRRDIFTSPDIYEAEVRALFEGGWIYLAHASQLPRPNDYITTFAGRRPIVIMRDAKGELRAFHNACPHKGAMICVRDRGNAPLHVCPYHSWSFTSDGANRAMKAKAHGGYTNNFLEAGHDLLPIARFDSHAGFLFGSLVPDVPSLADYLGDAAVLLELAAEQSPDGLEFVPGMSAFTYEANWKHQLENCSDGYHVTSVHPTYLKVAEKRAQEDRDSAVGGVWERSDEMLNDTVKDGNGGSFTFANGHVLNWGAGPMVPGHPLYERRDELIARVGPVRAKWMFYSRNLTIFPNLQVAENFSSQIRVMRPLGPGRTEMTTYCVGPRGEGARARAQRLRQYEDFFMPSGMATPDDLVLYEDCHVGQTGADDIWQSYDRGMTRKQSGTSEEAQELGIDVVTGVRGSSQLWDETMIHAYYRAWRDRLGAGGAAATPMLAEAAE